MSRQNYWLEAVQSSFDEHGIAATEAQIAAVARDMHDARDGERLAFYSPENPLIRENVELTRKLDLERRKIGCRKCNGRGMTEESFGPVGRTAISTCDECRGEGKVQP